MNIARDAVIRRARDISQLWRAAAWNELAQCFSEGIIQVGPRLKELSRGRSAAIDSSLDMHSSNFRHLQNNSCIDVERFAVRPDLICISFSEEKLEKELNSI